MATENMKHLVAVIERGEGKNKKSYWNRIGLAFEQRDGSWRLLFDYFPTNIATTTIQLRDPKEKEQADEA
jgi:hypothetical protein